MRGDIAGYGAVGTSLAMGESVVAVAVDAVAGLVSLLDEQAAARMVEPTMPRATP